jgi:hypothetical protein
MTYKDAKMLQKQYTKMNALAITIMHQFSIEDTNAFSFINEINDYDIKKLQEVELYRDYRDYYYSRLIKLYKLVEEIFDAFVPKHLTIELKDYIMN